jgi:hypothetical protein
MDLNSLDHRKARAFALYTFPYRENMKKYTNALSGTDRRRSHRLSHSESEDTTTQKRAALTVKRWDRNTSPVGWYVATYVVRFVELKRNDVNDPEARFLTWENTVLVKAKNLIKAYDKTVAIAAQHTKPYKGGKKRVDVQWMFEGITELLPVYEELQDGTEIMWAENRPRKLKTIRKWARKKSAFFQ